MENGLMSGGGKGKIIEGAFLKGSASGNRGGTKHFPLAERIRKTLELDLKGRRPLIRKAFEWKSGQSDKKGQISLGWERRHGKET